MDGGKEESRKRGKEARVFREGKKAQGRKKERSRKEGRKEGRTGWEYRMSRGLLDGARESTE